VGLTNPAHGWSNVSLQLSDEPKRGRNRLQRDLSTADRDGAVTRLKGLGATRVPWEYEEGDDDIVMADLDGNEFCVVQTSLAQDEHRLSQSPSGMPTLSTQGVPSLMARAAAAKRLPKDSHRHFI
jgi:hypothetical protein